VQSLLGLLAGGANVIMQLSRLPVGYGVANSTVDSGRVDRHPLKRTRTTCAFLVIAMFGSDHERLEMRREIAKAHQHVHSKPGEAIHYDAFAPQLQLWVAACLYKGVEDVYSLIYGPPGEARLERVYQYCRRFGSTLQVTDEMWPPTRSAFERYWQAGIAQARMDDLTRPYLQSIADFTFLVAPLGRLGVPLKPLISRLGWTITGGFLPQALRDELGLAWTERHQHRFDRFVRIGGAITRTLPRPLCQFPFNVYLWDTRRRIRLGRAVV
jgi:uncharacterized protein (DUF2236 family)